MDGLIGWMGGWNDVCMCIKISFSYFFPVCGVCSVKMFRFHIMIKRHIHNIYFILVFAAYNKGCQDKVERLRTFFIVLFKNYFWPLASYSS